MHRELKSILEEKLGSISDFHPLTGGDVSNACRLVTSSGSYFLKTHEAPEALNMFQLEKLGLESIAATSTIKTPRIFIVDCYKNSSFFVMEFIESKTASPNDFRELGAQLAQLHRIPQLHYGWDQDSFIGTLKQSNKLHHDWPAFYALERIQPQIQQAQQKGLLNPSEIPPSELIHQSCQRYLKSEYPSLVHGDLWSGNFLISCDGIPYLIDPSTYFGHANVDIAMSQLFGGFDPVFYEAYYQVIDIPPITEAERDLYQLYYLLVHLNLFGRSYYSSVKKLLEKYFR